MNDIKIRINNLFKIFGPEPKQCMQYVKQGITKQELLEKHGHVVGLRDINSILSLPIYPVQKRNKRQYP